MNERIKELANKAGFYVASGKIYIPTTSEEITECQKKFAELIIKECADISDASWHNGSAGYTAILKHFRVE